MRDDGPLSVHSPFLGRATFVSNELTFCSSKVLKNEELRLIFVHFRSSIVASNHLDTNKAEHFLSSRCLSMKVALTPFVVYIEIQIAFECCEIDLKFENMLRDANQLSFFQPRDGKVTELENQHCSKQLYTRKRVFV
jgi:hypothetical protein